MKAIEILKDIEESKWCGVKYEAVFVTKRAVGGNIGVVCNFKFLKMVFR